MLRFFKYEKPSPKLTRITIQNFVLHASPKLVDELGI